MEWENSYMIEHNCDECGTEITKSCYCKNCLDQAKEVSFQDGKSEGYDEGYTEAQQELESKE